MPSNYLRLRQKADAHFQAVQTRHAAAMQCQSGCSACCRRHFSVFPVEADQLAEAVRELEPRTAARVAGQSSKVLEEPHSFPDCPLLVDERCSVYENRPVICRTHGAPILVEEDGESFLDVCPLNFREPESLSGLPSESVMSLETLNLLLTAINMRYCGDRGRDPGTRISIAEVVLAALCHTSPADGRPDNA